MSGETNILRLAYNGLGVGLHQRGAYDESKKYLLLAKELTSEIGKLGVGHDQYIDIGGIGNDYAVNEMQLGNFEPARYKYILYICVCGLWPIFN